MAPTGRVSDKLPSRMRVMTSRARISHSARLMRRPNQPEPVNSRPRNRFWTASRLLHSDRSGYTVNLIVPRVKTMHTGHDFHQCGLARSVVTHQRHNLASVDFNRCAAQGVHRSKRFLNIPHRNQWNTSLLRSTVGAIGVSHSHLYSL